MERRHFIINSNDHDFIAFHYAGSLLKPKGDYIINAYRINGLIISFINDRDDTNWDTDYIDQDMMIDYAIDNVDSWEVDLEDKRVITPKPLVHDSIIC